MKDFRFFESVFYNSNFSKIICPHKSYESECIHCIALNSS